MINEVINEIRRHLKEFAPKLTNDQKSRMYKILNSNNSNFIGYGNKHSEIEKLVKEIHNEYQFSYEDVLYDEDLSDEAKKFEQIFIKYKNEMELVGKNWRVARTKTLSEKLKIPYDILIEIKLKYCPNTRKVVRKQILKSFLKENAGNEKAER